MLARTAAIFLPDLFNAGIPGLVVCWRRSGYSGNDWTYRWLYPVLNDAAPK